MSQAQPYEYQVKMGYQQPSPPNTGLQYNYNFGTSPGTDIMQSDMYAPAFYPQIQQNYGDPDQSQYFHSVHQPKTKIERPWWLWAIAFADIALAILLSSRLFYNMATLEKVRIDRNVIMWTLFLIFISLTIHFTMGIGLIAGLKSTDKTSTVWYCQAWIYGAYYHFGELCLTFLILLMGQPATVRNDASQLFTLFILIVKLVFRVISYILVRRFMIEMGKDEELQAAQHQRLFSFCYQSQHDNPHEQYQMETTLPSPPPPAPLPIPGQVQGQTTQVQEQPKIMGTNEYYYCAPQVSMLMTMMMNNSSGPTAT